MKHVLQKIFTLWKRKSSNSKIRLAPQCLDPNKLHFVSVDGFYYPCCFLRVGHANLEVKKLLKERIKELDLGKYSREEIYRSWAWKTLMKKVEKDPFETCISMCKAANHEEGRGRSFDGRHGYKIFSNQNPQSNN